MGRKGVLEEVEGGDAIEGEGGGEAARAGLGFLKNMPVGCAGDGW